MNRLSIIIAITIILFVACQLLRYSLYNEQIELQLFQPNLQNCKQDIYFDTMYRKSLKLNKSVLSDYEQVDLQDITDSYNAFQMRKYIFSNPSQSTIELAEIKDNQSILDLGAGTALVAIYICKQLQNIKYTCVVNSKQLYDISTKNIKNNNLCKQIQVVLLDFDSLFDSSKITDSQTQQQLNSILNSKYDRILLLETMGYSRNYVELISQCKQLLNNDGKILIKTITLNPNCQTKEHKKLINLWQYDFNVFTNIMYKLNNLDFKQIHVLNENLTKMSFIYANCFDLIKLCKYTVRNKINPEIIYEPIIQNICVGTIIKLSI